MTLNNNKTKKSEKAHVEFKNPCKHETHPK